jgi:hypothetical protein
VKIPDGLATVSGEQLPKYTAYTVDNDKVLLKALTYDDMETLKSKMMISPITQETFNNM